MRFNETADVKKPENTLENNSKETGGKNKEISEFPKELGEKTEEYPDFPKELGEKVEEYPDFPKELGEKVEEYPDFPKELGEKTETSHDDVKESVAPKNKIEGIAREEMVESELNKSYPAEKGYDTMREVLLRNENGEIVRDPETGEGRRVDFAVLKDGKVCDLVEVTSPTASKEMQTAKEERIRENGGNYIKDVNGQLFEIPSDLHTRIERRELPNENI